MCNFEFVLLKKSIINQLQVYNQFDFMNAGEKIACPLILERSNTYYNEALASDWEIDMYGVRVEITYCDNLLCPVVE